MATIATAVLQCAGVLKLVLYSGSIITLCPETLLVFRSQVQERFDVDIKPLPEEIDASTYMSTA